MYVSVSSYEPYKALFDMKLYINKQVQLVLNTQQFDLCYY